MKSEEAIKFINEEKNEFGNVFSTVTFGINDIIDFKEGTDIEERYFIKNNKIVEKYIKTLEEGKEKISKKKKVLFFDVDQLSEKEIDTVITGIELFKEKYKLNLNKIRECSSCKCLKCLENCKFGSCLACAEVGKVTECDKQKYNIIMFRNFKTELYNNETKGRDEVKVLAEITIDGDSTSYRIIKADNEFLILSYEHKLGQGDNYGEVLDTEKFNFIADLYEKNIQNLM